MCGAHWSSDEPTAINQIRSLEVPATIHNNCSGKHAGMLVLAALLGTSPDGYAALSHPVQQSILGTLEAMTGIDLMQSCITFSLLNVTITAVKFCLDIDI